LISKPARRKSGRRLWANTVAATGWGESTFHELAWDKSRSAAVRWALGGALVGMLVALVAFAPAAWLASAVASATQRHLLLSDARGTVWSGSAVPVLSGGPDSHDASALPGRLEWTAGLVGLALQLQARQACCLNGVVTLQMRPGFGRILYVLVPPQGGVGQWPSAWLAGLGTPFNTLQLGGTVRLSSPGLTLESVQGRWRLEGRADIDLVDVSSRVSTLDALGSYRLTLTGDPAQGGAPQLTLNTIGGALLLSGSGSVSPSGVRFRGEARAASPSDDAALSNLLNIIGRRDGARSVISIG
jgi:general secretion pathway protein N